MLLIVALFSSCEFSIKRLNVFIARTLLIFLKSLCYIQLLQYSIFTTASIEHYELIFILQERVSQLFQLLTEQDSYSILQFSLISVLQERVSQIVPAINGAGHLKYITEFSVISVLQERVSQYVPALVRSGSYGL